MMPHSWWWWLPLFELCLSVGFSGTVFTLYIPAAPLKWNDLSILIHALNYYQPPELSESYCRLLRCRRRLLNIYRRPPASLWCAAIYRAAKRLISPIKVSHWAGAPLLFHARKPVYLYFISKGLQLTRADCSIVYFSWWRRASPIAPCHWIGMITFKSNNVYRRWVML